jgi:hypothetical protein
VISALIEMFGGLWGPTDPDGQLAKDRRKRADRAYEAAWKARDRGALDDGGLLLREMQAANVPGAFLDLAADPFLSLYVDSWRAGKDPKLVRAESRQALRQP